MEELIAETQYCKSIAQRVLPNSLFFERNFWSSRCIVKGVTTGGEMKYSFYFLLVSTFALTSFGVEAEKAQEAVVSDHEAKKTETGKILPGSKRNTNETIFSVPGDRNLVSSGKACKDSVALTLLAKAGRIAESIKKGLNSAAKESRPELKLAQAQLQCLNIQEMLAYEGVVTGASSRAFGRIVASLGQGANKDDAIRLRQLCRELVTSKSDLDVKEKIAEVYRIMTWRLPTLEHVFSSQIEADPNDKGHVFIRDLKKDLKPELKAY